MARASSLVTNYSWASRPLHFNVLLNYSFTCRKFSDSATCG